VKKKRLNGAIMRDRLAHIAYDKQFKQQWQGVLDRRKQHEKVVALNQPEKQPQNT